MSDEKSEKASENISDDEENLETTDQEEGVQKKVVHMSAIDSKVKLNDYIFDERQNLHEDLVRVELKQVVKKQDNVIGI